MQADDVAKLLESTQASAEAVVKVDQALEKRFGDEKKEKFSEASRVIRQPDLWSTPRTMRRKSLCGLTGALASEVG